MLNFTKIENGKRIIDKEYFYKNLEYLILEIGDKYITTDVYRLLKCTLNEIESRFLGELNFISNKLEDIEISSNTHLHNGFTLYLLTITNKKTKLSSVLHIHFVFQEDLSDTVLGKKTWQIFQSGLPIVSGVSDLGEILDVVIIEIRKIYKGW